MDIYQICKVCSKQVFMRKTSEEELLKENKANKIILTCLFVSVLWLDLNIK